MARLDPLIRVRKHLVDEKQRILAGLYRDLEALRAQKDQFLVDMAREQALIEADITNIAAREWFGGYAAGVRQKIAALEEAMTRMDTRIMIATDDVRAAFAELKKIEITDRERKKREKKAQDAKESQSFDDIGLDGFRRKGEEDGA